MRLCLTLFSSIWKGKGHRLQSRIEIMKKDKGGTVSEQEVAFFGALSSSWWDANGPMKPLHSYTALRIPFIRDGLLKSAPDRDSRMKSLAPLKGYSLLDVGCGGGFLVEGLAKLGATVVGMDPATESINVAESHLPVDLKSLVTYECASIEDFTQNNPTKRFDGVIMSEVIEHVDNPDHFLSIAVQLTKDKGSVILTTPNRTIASYLVVILGAEYILKMIPLGTHQWEKFITDQELTAMLIKNGCSVTDVKGSMYNPLTNVWSWSWIKGVMYLLHAVKET